MTDTANVPAQSETAENAPAEEVKSLESYGDVMHAMVLKINSTAKDHNDAVNFLKTKSGDKVEALKAIAEESDHTEIAKLRGRIAQMSKKLEELNSELTELAEIEYQNNPKYAPLTPEKVTETQTKIAELRKQWTKGKDAIEFMAPMEEMQPADVEQLMKDHVTALVAHGRKSHATSSDGAAKFRPRIQNLHVIANGEDKHVTGEDGKENLTILAKYLKNFGQKLTSGDITNALLAEYKVADWDGIPDSVSYEIKAPTTDDPNNVILVKFDRA